MRPSYGLGILVIVLLTAAVALLGLLGLQGAVSMGLLLAGLWTIAAAFLIVATQERSYYAGWGIIIAGLSLSYFIPIQYALAVILIAIVGLIVVSTYFARAKANAPSPGSAPASAS